MRPDQASAKTRNSNGQRLRQQPGSRNLVRAPMGDYMRFIQVLLCFAVAVTASSSGLTAGDDDQSDAAAATEPRTVIYVNAGAAPGGNGSWRFPYRNLPPALVKARATSDAVTIRMGPGRYVIDSTLVIDRPLILRGASELIKGPEGFPTGGVVAGTATRIVASAKLGAEPLFSVGRDDGVVISGRHDSQLGHQRTWISLATEMTIRRVQDYAVSGNVFRTGGKYGLESIASSGQVIGNHFSHLLTGAILAGGYAESPSKVTFQGQSFGRERLGRPVAQRRERVHTGTRRSAFCGRPGQRPVSQRRFWRSLVRHFSLAWFSGRYTGDRQHPRVSQGKPHS